MDISKILHELQKMPTYISLLTRDVFDYYLVNLYCKYPRPMSMDPHFKLHSDNMTLDRRTKCALYGEREHDARFEFNDVYAIRNKTYYICEKSVLVWSQGKRISKYATHNNISSAYVDENEWLFLINSKNSLSILQPLNKRYILVDKFYVNKSQRIRNIYNQLIYLYDNLRKEVQIVDFHGNNIKKYTIYNTDDLNLNSVTFDCVGNSIIVDFVKLEYRNDNGILVNNKVFPCRITNTAISNDGVVYVSTSDGKLYKSN